MGVADTCKLWLAIQSFTRKYKDSKAHLRDPSWTYEVAKYESHLRRIIRVVYLEIAIWYARHQVPLSELGDPFVLTPTFIINNSSEPNYWTPGKQYLYWRLNALRYHLTSFYQSHGIDLGMAS
jgi:hypothetical protein